MPRDFATNPRHTVSDLTTSLCYGRAMRTLAVLAVACLVWTSTASADDTITVWLKDGSMVRGELVERVPNKHLTIKLATGEVRKIEWTEIDHDSIGEKKETPEPKKEDPAEDDDSAHKPNAKNKAASDYVPPDVSTSDGAGGLLVVGADGYQLLIISTDTSRGTPRTPCIWSSRGTSSAAPRSSSSASTRRRRSPRAA